MNKQEQQKLNDQLLNAAQNGYLGTVKELLGMGAELEAKNIYGWTALHFASTNGHLEVLKELLGRGAELEAKDKNEWTALTWAAVQGRVECVIELLGRGAKLDLFTLARYPKEVLEIKRKTSVDVWSDILFFVIKEQEKYSKEDFKNFVLGFLDKTKTEIPENIYIILNTLI